MNWSTPDGGEPLPAPVIQLGREYGCQEAADLCGVTLPAIHGAIRTKRLPAFADLGAAGWARVGFSEVVGFWGAGPIVRVVLLGA